MKTSLSHLPQAKQDDLRRIVEIVLACAQAAADGNGKRSEVGGQKSERADEAASPPSSPSDLRPLTSDLSRPTGGQATPGSGGTPGGGGVEQIVLYGSHARGDWTYDKYKEDWITYEYVSDYDILIITDNDSGLHKNHAVWDEVRDRFAFGRPREGERSAGLSLIVHNLHEVNKALEENRYFFADIQREGVLLFDAGRVKLAERKEPTAEERRERAKDEFERWFTSSTNAYSIFEFSLEKGLLNDAAFMLHQATERLYTTVSLVFTDYRPKLHDLYKLRDKIAELDRRTLTAFPRKTKDEKRLFKLLADAYVHARYTKTYSITREELEYLAERVQKLRGIVEEVCRERIE